LCVVHGLERPGDEARDEAGDQDAALACGAHVAADQVQQPDRAADIGIHDALRLSDVLVQKRLAQSRPALAQKISIGRSPRTLR